MKNLTDFRETVETSVDLCLENVWPMKMTICPWSSAWRSNK